MSEAEFHEMRQPRIEKVVVHMGVGVGGRELADAEEILEDIVGQQVVRTQARDTVGEFDIREGDPIGAKVTLRDEQAEQFLEMALDLVDLSRSQFDDVGNFSFGLIFMLLSIPGVLLIVLGIAAGSAVVTGIAVTLGVLYMIAVSLVSSALDAIFRAAVYLYAHEGHTPDQFGEGMMQSVMRQRS